MAISVHLVVCEFARDFLVTHFVAGECQGKLSCDDVCSESEMLEIYWWNIVKSLQKDCLMYFKV